MANQIKSNTDCVVDHDQVIHNDLEQVTAVNAVLHDRINALPQVYPVSTTTLAVPAQQRLHPALIAFFSAARVPTIVQVDDTENMSIIVDPRAGG